MLPASPSLSAVKTLRWYGSSCYLRCIPAETKNLAFSRGNLEVMGSSGAASASNIDTAPSASDVAAAAAANVPTSRLSARVSKMLHTIEKELDKVRAGMNAAGFWAAGNSSC